MSTLVWLIGGAVQFHLVLALLLLGVAARRQHRRADVRADPGGAVSITDEVDVVAAYADLATAAAERARLEADQAQDAALRAGAARDMAEQRHRLILRHAEAAGEAPRLLQRAALDAYQRGQLSVSELNRIWQHTRDMTGSESGPAVVPLGWELRVREARRRYDEAEAAVTRAEEEARDKVATAATLTEQARAAESHLSLARRSASTGLVGLLRANWADPVTP